MPQAKSLADGKLDVIRPQDLGHHLANLHVPASSQAVQGSELMQSSTAADSALLLGGDLLVTVWEVTTHAAHTAREAPVEL